jgi:glycosyltransferase involved in cell wall biosynthesis
MMRKISVALIHYSAPPVVGGVEAVLARHADLMAQAGHAVRVVAGRGEQWQPRVGFHRLPLIDSRHARVLAAKHELDQGRLPQDFAPLTAEIADGLTPALDGADVIIAHNVCSLHKNLALTATLRQIHTEAADQRLILWHHDLAWTTPRYRAELHDGYPWDLLRRDWGAEHVAVSGARQTELADLMGIPVDAIRVIPNGIASEAFFKLELQTQSLMERFNLGQAAPLLLLPVRVTRRKNIELALRVAAELKAEFPDTMLVVTGPPGPHNPANQEYFVHLQQLRATLGLERAAVFLAEAVEAFLPDAVIADLYRLADVLLLPSREEGFGIPLLEAALSRMPVFCADIPPLRALGGDEARYFDPDANPRDVAGALAAFLVQDPAFLAASRARRQYDWKRIYTAQIAPLLER